MLQAAANCAGTQLQLLPGNYTGKETGCGFFLFPDIHNAWKHWKLRGRNENFAGNWGLGRWLWVCLGFFNGATSPEAWPKLTAEAGRGVLAPEFPLRTFLGLKLFQDGLLKVTQLILVFLVILKSLLAFNKAALSSLWEHSLGKVLLSQTGFASLNKVWERKKDWGTQGMQNLWDGPQGHFVGTSW